MILGKMKERIQLQQLTETVNSLNEIDNDWETVATRWASVESLTAKEQDIANQINAFISFKVILRTFPTLKHNFQFLWNGKALGIESIVEKDGFQTCLCITKEEAN